MMFGDEVKRKEARKKKKKKISCILGKITVLPLFNEM